jgi:hypothetical protein
MREDIRFLVFWARLTSLRMMFSNFIHLPVNDNISYVLPHMCAGFQQNKTSTLWSPNKSGAWSQPTGREHELPRAGTALRPELAMSGLLNSMMEKVFQEDRKR